MKQFTVAWSASKTLRGITGFHVLEEKAKVDKGQISEYRVTLDITFILDDQVRL